jgi:hypothetical protein
MPFGFYYAPYLVTTLKHYDPVTFYEKLTGLLSFSASRDMFRRRQKSYRNRVVGRVNWARTFWTRAELGVYRRLLNMLRQDSAFRAFHEGRATSLPEFYHRAYEQSLGPFAELISRNDRRPNLDQDDPAGAVVGAEGRASRRAERTASRR